MQASKNGIILILLLLGEMLVSCQSEQKRLEKEMLNYASGYFSFPTFVESSIKTSSSGVPHMYSGYYTLSAYGESVDLPVILSSKDGIKDVRFAIDDNSIVAQINDFNERIRIAYNGGTVNNYQSSTVPDWVYGTWTCTTSYGTETIKIDKWEIADLSYGSYKTASYSYEDGMIKAKFPGEGGIVTVFRVDLVGRRIEYGDGIYMHKR